MLMQKCSDLIEVGQATPDIANKVQSLETALHCFLVTIHARQCHWRDSKNL